jgi:hypothetical protein
LRPEHATLGGCGSIENAAQDVIPTSNTDTSPTGGVGVAVFFVGLLKEKKGGARCRLKDVDGLIRKDCCTHLGLLKSEVSGHDGRKEHGKEEAVAPYGVAP